MEDCVFCGRCCHWIDSKGIRHKCKYLVRLTKTKTRCRIYKKRLGTIIYKNGDLSIGCIMRCDSEFDYPGCPLNTGKEIRE